MTRKEAIGNLNMIRVAFIDTVTVEQGKLIDDTFRAAIKALERPTWIFTSDRNPGSDGRYLVSTDGFDIEIAYYQNGAWHKARQIIAWMPLPKSYREDNT